MFAGDTVPFVIMIARDRPLFSPVRADPTSPRGVFVCSRIYPMRNFFMLVTTPFPLRILGGRLRAWCVCPVCAFVRPCTVYTRHMCNPCTSINTGSNNSSAREGAPGPGRSHASSLTRRLNAQRTGKSTRNHGLYTGTRVCVRHVRAPGAGPVAAGGKAGIPVAGPGPSNTRLCGAL